MELFLLRHAQAEDPHLYAYDHQRPLSDQGRHEQQRIAQVLALLLSPLDYLLSSPLLRARQTAEITAAAMPFPCAMTETALLGEDCSVGNVVKLLQQYPPQARLLCVGHEPFMTRLSASFLNAASPRAVDFPRSALLGLHFPGHPEPGLGTLRVFLHPADMLALSQQLQGPGSAAEH
jgi:phosphohistidine phosphatase